MQILVEIQGMQLASKQGQVRQQFQLQQPSHFLALPLPLRRVLLLQLHLQPSLVAEPQTLPRTGSGNFSENLCEKLREP